MDFRRVSGCSFLYTLVIVVTSSSDSNCNVECNWMPSSLQTVCLEVDCLHNFNEDTKILHISDSTLTDLPENVFAGLENLTQIHIHDTKIGRINSHSFNTTHPVDDVYIHHAVIGSIDKYAFEKSTFSQGGKFNIFEVHIGTIHSYAFFEMEDLESFSFYGANVTTIESKAFYKLASFKSFNIYETRIGSLKSLALDGFTEMKNVRIFKSYIANLEQNTLEAFTSDIGEEFFSYYITVDCGCHLGWLMQAREYMSDFILDGITCSTSERTPTLTARGQSLGDLNLTDICPLRYTTAVLNTKLPQSQAKPTQLENATLPLIMNSTSSGAAFLKPALNFVTITAVFIWICFVLYS